MKITNTQQITKLKSSIGEDGVVHLMRLFRKGCTIWFIPDGNAANFEPDLEPEERTFARRRLQQHPWTWIHRSA